MSSWNCKFSILSHLFLLPLHIVSKLFLYRITFYTFITGSDNKLRKCFKSAELTCDQWQSVFDVPCDNLESESLRLEQFNCFRFRATDRNWSRSPGLLMLMSVFMFFSVSNVQKERKKSVKNAQLKIIINFCIQRWNFPTRLINYLYFKLFSLSLRK